MSRTRQLLPRCAVLLCLGLAAVRAQAQLADASPFLAAGVTGASGGGSADSTDLELRGIMTTPEGARFDIFDPVKKSGTWSAVNERGHDFMIKSADLARSRVLVQAAGRMIPLSLKTAKVGVITPEGRGPGNGQGGQGAAVAPADEAARLAAVAEEVRRRRQLRDQAAQGGAQAAPTPPADQSQSQDQGQGRRRNRQNQGQ
jgi:hypothetical protein